MEVELSSPKQVQENPPPTAGEKSWTKRDVVHQAKTWDLTLDDTPGWPRFNLEFILGGESRRGFDDATAVHDLTRAVKEIRQYCEENGGKELWLDRTADGKVRDNRLKLVVPKMLPPNANVQLTAGASLAGLQAVLAENYKSLSSPKEGELPQPGARLAKLVISQPGQKSLAKAYIGPDAIGKFGVLPGSVVANQRLMDALSSMVTLIATFLANYGTGMANIKEATPILWKTPLNLFFDSNDLKEFQKDLWPPLAKALFAEKFSVVITHPPEGTKAADGRDISRKIPVSSWLLELPIRDLLTEADAEYDHSFGGIGKLERGAGPSRGQPLFEFRSFPNTLGQLELNLEQSAILLSEVNQPR